MKFCHRLGLNYVSCSPFRVPVARLAAAQAAQKVKPTFPKGWRFLTEDPSVTRDTFSRAKTDTGKFRVRGGNLTIDALEFRQRNGCRIAQLRKQFRGQRIFDVFENDITNVFLAQIIFETLSAGRGLRRYDFREEKSFRGQLRKHSH